MPGAGRAEVYFIAIMMLLILVGSGVALYFFFKTYRKEMAERAARQEAKREALAADEPKANGGPEEQNHAAP
ncbi:MAG TPA: hypothetical protein VK918_07070 [Pyrinomonadaceae bacterium]|nr:hypothetical protein [Pyrinomonadaceae bacterium]